MALGGALGLAAGVAAGAALYFGLVSIPLRHLFTVTSWLVLLLAAGMASQAAAFLLQADLLPPLGTELVGHLVPAVEDSLAGRVLHTLIGYTAQPAGIQLVFYLATLLVIGGLMRLVGSPARALCRSPRPASGRRPVPARWIAPRTPPVNPRSLRFGTTVRLVCSRRNHAELAGGYGSVAAGFLRSRLQAQPMT